MTNYKLIAASGFFNPLHIGHIRYLEAAKRLGTHLVVIVNNDEQVNLKKNTPFMKEDERVEIVRALRCVDEALLSIDKNKEICDSLEMVRPHIFVNGGDRRGFTRKEKALAKKLNIKLVSGVGGRKIRSSSKILEDYEENTNNRR